jgi:hypothetical protein
MMITMKQKMTSNLAYQKHNKSNNTSHLNRKSLMKIVHTTMKVKAKSNKMIEPTMMEAGNNLIGKTNAKAGVIIKIKEVNTAIVEKVVKETTEAINVIVMAAIGKKAAREKVSQDIKDLIDTKEVNVNIITMETGRKVATVIKRVGSVEVSVIITMRSLTNLRLT